MVAKRYILFLLLLSAFVINVIGAEVKLSVTPYPGQRAIEAGSLFYINIDVINGSGSPEQPQNVPGAKITYFVHSGSRSSMTSVNGNVTRRSQETWTLTAKAQKEGSYSFGPISVDGVKSNVVKYEIVKAGAKSNASASGSAAVDKSMVDSDDDDSKPKYIGHGDQNLFLKANVSKTTVYEQEAIVYTVKLYTSYAAVKFIGATSAPKFDGFVVEESKDISNSLSYETYDGKSYATAIIARYIIFPQMTGRLKISGNTYTISVDRREYYHDPFWGNIGYSQPMQLNVSPNDLTIDVKSLPEPKPIDFSGGVGKFNISSSLKGDDFKTNQTGSIVYTISGTGNIKYVQMPDLNTLYPPQLEVYTPTSKQDVNIGSNTVSGNVQFDYSFMPLEEGKYRIPDIKFVYFNTETNKYESSVAKGYEIDVKKGEGSAKSQRRKQLHFDSNLQNVNTSDLHKANAIYVTTFIYWLWYIIPGMLLVISIICYSMYSKSHADMAAFNSKRANKLARRRLRKAYTAMKKKNRDLFYDELLKALWGYVGYKLKMPTSELMRDNIRQKLTDKGISSESIDKMIGLIDEAEFAKYSSAGSDSGMNKDYQEAIDAINLMEKSLKKADNE